MRVMCGVFCAGMLAAAAQAAPVGQDEARRLLFDAEDVAIALNPNAGLSAEQAALVEAIVRTAQAQGAAQYYGAVALSPDFFAMMAADPQGAAGSGLIQISQQYHGAQAASAAALRACEAARTRGQAPCVTAAQVLPAGYRARALELSSSATQAFRDFRKGRGAKAFAASQTTTAFSVARGAGAAASALAGCNAEAAKLGAADCLVVIED